MDNKVLYSCILVKCTIVGKTNASPLPTPHTDYRVTTSDFLCPGSPGRAEKPGNSPWNSVGPGGLEPGTMELGT